MSIDVERHTFRLPEEYKILPLVLEFFHNTPCYQLPLSSFLGTGVYALYYLGDFPHYACLSERNQMSCNYPIYVGKAVARGWRTGRTSSSQGNELANRLREHARSIQQTDTLRLSDFKCRFIVLNGDESSIINSAEAELIRNFQPLWNSVIDGFGNHDPGRGRYDQAISEWDALHPGRSWVQKLTGTLPPIDRIISKTLQHLAYLKAMPDNRIEDAQNLNDTTLSE